MTSDFPFQDLQPDDDLPHETTTGSRLVQDGAYLRVRIDDVVLPSGRISERGIVERPDSVVVIAVTTDDHVLLIRQYRYAIDQHIIELPAGLIDPGESPLETARRELQEETGHDSSDLHLIANVYMSPGYTTERTAFVLAEKCVPVAHEADPDEPIRLARIPIGEIPALLEPGSNQLTQAQAMLGLLWLLRLRGL